MPDLRAVKKNKKINKTKKVATELVDDLFDDIKITQKNKEIIATRVETLKTNSSTAWLEEEVDRVTAENERLLKELANAKLVQPPQPPPPQNPPPQPSGNVEKSVQNFFNEVEAIYLGTGGIGKPMASIPTKQVLDQMLKYFNFIRPNRPQPNRPQR
jgi:hypothetical protein